MKQLFESLGSSTLVFSFLLLCNCQKDIDFISTEEVEPSETTSGQNTGLQVVWQTPLGVVDTNIYLTEGVNLVEDKVVATPGTSDRTIVNFMDKQTGAFLFDWQEWFTPAYLSSNVQIIDGQVFGNSWKQTFLIDSDNGQSIWRSTPIENGTPYASITLGNIFHPSWDKAHHRADFSFLSSLDNKTGIRDTMLVIPKLDDYEPNMQPPSAWINTKGDTVLIFVLRSLNFGGDLDERLDAYACYMSVDSIVWRLLDFDLEGSSRIGPPLIEDDLVYIAGESTLYCLNAADGTTVWQHRFEDDTNGFSESLFTVSYTHLTLPTILLV